MCIYTHTYYEFIWISSNSTVQVHFSLLSFFCNFFPALIVCGIFTYLFDPSIHFKIVSPYPWQMNLLTRLQYLCIEDYIHLTFFFTSVLSNNKYMRRLIIWCYPFEPLCYPFWAIRCIVKSRHNCLYYILGFNSFCFLSLNSK